jgi:outer membrane protein assembly factor BamB
MRMRIVRRSGLEKAARFGAWLLACVGIAWVSGSPSPARAQLANSAWPMAHHDVRHTGRSPYQGPLTSQVKWIAASHRSIKGSPIIGPDGAIYLGVAKTVFACNDDGSLRWDHQLPSVMRRNTAAIAADGQIFVGARDNRLWSISSGGIAQWSYTVGNDGDVNTSPVIVRDPLDPPGVYVVYMAGTWNGIVHALDDDGTLLWRLGSEGGVSYSSPAVDPTDGTIYIATTAGHLRAMNADGSLKWDIRVGGQVRFGSPSIATDGTIYVPTREGLVAVSPAGDSLWEFQTEGRVAMTPAIDASGNIYFGSVGGAGGSGAAFYSLQPDKDVNWVYEGGEKFYSSAALGADGTVYTTAGGVIMALDPSDGSVIWEYATPRGRDILSTPAIAADGTLYVTADGLYAFGPAGAPAAGNCLGN